MIVMVWPCQRILRKVSELNLRKKTRGVIQNKTVQSGTERHQHEGTELPKNYRTVERQERLETLLPSTCTKQKKSSIVNSYAVCISHVTNLITSKQSQYPLRLWDEFVSNKLHGSIRPHNLKNVS
jgi:hypothetical protein